MSLINAGEDPKYIAGSSTFVSTWSCATSHQLDGIGCGEGEQRLYVISDAEHIECCFPPRITRDPNCTLLNWELLKLVPPSFYVVCFADACSGKLRAVPEHKLALDGYPEASKSKSDPEYKAGFTKKSDLRLALRPKPRMPFDSSGRVSTSRCVQQTHGQCLAR